MARVPGDQPQVRRTGVPPEMVRGSAAQEPRTLDAAARLASHDRLALSDVRARSADANPLGRTARSNRSSTRRSERSRRTIFERDGKVIVEKTCPSHGTFVDTLAINPAFLRRIESLFPGRDFPAITDRLHNHGTSSIKYGRGAVLTIDLTNRCNMMCDPCFMDANQVGYVHELTLARGRSNCSTTRSASSPGVR